MGWELRGASLPVEATDYDRGAREREQPLDPATRSTAAVRAQRLQMPARHLLAAQLLKAGLGAPL